eukprot:8893919-Lingulodinium_polyedra.AAC.1
MAAAWISKPALAGFSHFPTDMVITGLPPHVLDAIGTQGHPGPAPLLPQGPTDTAVAPASMASCH